MQQTWSRHTTRIVAEKLDVDANTIRGFFLASYGCSPNVLEVACFEIANKDPVITLVLKRADGTVIADYSEGPIRRCRKRWALNYPADSIDLTVIPQTGLVRLIFRECGIECHIPAPKHCLCQVIFFEMISYFVVISVPLFLAALAARMRTFDV